MAITLNELKSIAKMPELVTARQFASKAVSIVKQERRAKAQTSETINNLKTWRLNNEQKQS